MISAYYEVIQSTGLDDKVYYIVYMLTERNGQRGLEVCRTTKIDQMLDSLKDAMETDLALDNIRKP